MSPAQNPCTPHHAITLPHHIIPLHHTIALYHCITPPHHVTALHHRITSLHHTIASRHCITPSHYVTVSHHCAITHEAPEAPPTPLGDITSLYRSTTEPCDILGRHYCPKTFPNSSARHPWATLCPFFVAGESALIPSRISSETHLQHPWATLQAYIVPQQGHTTLSGDITAPKRSPTVLRDTIGQHFATFSSLESPH